MCFYCYEQYGKPHIVNERTKEAAQLIRLVDDMVPSTFGVHLIIDDWNITDSIIKQTLKGTVLIQERECFEMLLSMTEDERASALAINEGWL